MELIDNEGKKRDFFFEVSKYSAHLWKSHLERHLAIYELYQKTKELPGSIAEFGVYNGSTFYFLARLIEIFHGTQYDKFGTSSHHLYGFDTFEGIVKLHPEDHPDNPKVPHNKLGGFSQSKEMFFKDFEDFKNNTTIPKRVHLIEGDVSLTFPKFLKENPGVRFRLVLLDMDLYEPTKVVLDSILDFMVPGGIIVFDEYGFQEWPGETKAADEFIREHGLKLKAISHAFAPAAYTII
jgi:hypothetical protein